ncbi:hypothetical protein HDU67_004666 [Dinochytrium kinnereticum]|nr:hypothetical protein HDU67_004666 [Dinochytrium kinnereticum]
MLATSHLEETFTEQQHPVITGVFEFHITVKVPTTTASKTPTLPDNQAKTTNDFLFNPTNPSTPPTNFLTTLTEFCQAHNLKLTIIHLSSGVFPDQVMIGRYLVGTSNTLPNIITETYITPLKNAGFIPTRLKLESLMSNAGVPADPASKARWFPSSSYFEFHWKVEVMEGMLSGLRKVVGRVGEGRLHLSRNVYGKGGGGVHVFLTAREYVGGRREARVFWEGVSEGLRREGVKVVKAEREFVVVDTNLELDAGWDAEGVLNEIVGTVISNTAKTVKTSSSTMPPTNSPQTWSNYAETYALWTPISSRPFAQAALDIINLPAMCDRLNGTRRLDVLDVAAGTGAFGLEVVERCGMGRVRVVAGDFSEGMVGVMRREALQRFGSVGLEECFVATVMDGESLELADESVDVAACIFGVFLMDDGLKCISEMHRVLRPGGLCVLTTWQDTFLHSLALQALAKMDPTRCSSDQNASPPRSRNPWDDGGWVAERMLTRVGFATAQATLSTRVMEVREEEIDGFAEFLAGGPGVQMMLERMGWDGGGGGGGLGLGFGIDAMRREFASAVVQVLREQGDGMRGAVSLTSTSNTLIGIKSNQ